MSKINEKFYKKVSTVENPQAIWSQVKALFKIPLMTAIKFDERSSTVYKYEVPKDKTKSESWQDLDLSKIYQKWYTHPSLPPTKQAVRCLFWSDNDIYMWWAYFDNVAVSLPNSDYFVQHITGIITWLKENNLFNSIKIKEFQKVLVKTLDWNKRYDNFEDFRRAAKRNKAGIEGEKLQNIHKLYKYTHVIMHLMFHDMAHQLEPENLIQWDISLPPYHVYQFMKLKSLLNKQGLNWALADMAKYTRTAFSRSFRNELWVGHIQSKFETGKATADFLEIFRQYDIQFKKSFWKWREALSFLPNKTIMLDGGHEFNAMQQYAMQTDLQEYMTNVEMLVNQVESITDEIATMVWTYYKKNETSLSTEKAWGLMEDLCNKLGCSSTAQNLAKEKKNYYQTPLNYWWITFISSLLKEYHKNNSPDMYQYIDNRIHETSFLLCFPDNGIGNNKMITLLQQLNTMLFIK